jgi:hypothetical protein
LTYRGEYRASDHSRAYEEDQDEQKRHTGPSKVVAMGYDSHDRDVNQASKDVLRRFPQIPSKVREKF